ncbi:MAG: citrate/2-methylcitrate synthase [Eggerthellaceae bacterium]|nr:citrate/2-methylcitrate synthase [Eggerthellaceae bacterium]
MSSAPASDSASTSTVPAAAAAEPAAFAAPVADPAVLPTSAPALPLLIDETPIRVVNRASIDEVEPIEISEEEARRVSLYNNFRAVNSVDPALYERYDVKRGLRNADGTGVLAGMTNISNVHGYVMSDGERRADEGSLRLRGYEIYDLLGSGAPDRRFRYEEIAYLLLMGDLPTQARLDSFIEVIDSQRELPDGFTASMLMRHTPPDIMNVLARSVLQLYAYDEHAEDRTPEHEIHTALSLISRLPRIMVLTYYSKRAKYEHESMIMHRFIPGHSTAETVLSMLRPDRQFTPEEARMLDIMMCLHAEHGGGNNSTFATRVLSSADTDAYSAYSAAIGSLKGHRHGGANHQVRAMQAEIKENVGNWESDDEVAAYLARIVNKQAYDHTGLVYGMGHAVYTKSDPRAVICKRFAEQLARGTEFEAEFNLLCSIERLTPEVLRRERGTRKEMCANVDMYSGFVYSMMGIPEDLYTPLFACARMAGWAAHRFEEIGAGKRIIRPAYKNTHTTRREYKPIEER